VIRLVFLPLIEKRRKELIKNIKKIGKESKVARRVIIRDVNEVLKAKKKATEIIEDKLKVREKDIKKVIGEYITKVDKLVLVKEE
jgi:ribosome recycling factor